MARLCDSRTVDIYSPWLTKRIEKAQDSDHTLKKQAPRNHALILTAVHPDKAISAIATTEMMAHSSDRSLILTMELVLLRSSGTQEIRHSRIRIHLEQQREALSQTILRNLL